MLVAAGLNTKICPSEQNGKFNWIVLTLVDCHKHKSSTVLINTTNM